ncbi:MAG: sirohydrochlorin chelatase [Planctomycetes bacterium]|nr:sirohydrochlorin chelatase [Planctomycetota bacterium]
MPKKIVIIVGHGSRVQKSNGAFEGFVKQFANRVPEFDFRLAFVELAEPGFKDALHDALACTEEVLVLPLFLFVAAHIKQDIMGIISEVRETFTDKNIYLSRALGVDQNMVDLVHKRITHACTAHAIDTSDTAILMIGRGSSDVDANNDFLKLVHLVTEKADYKQVDYGFIAVTKPTIEEALDRLINEGYRTILLEPYLIFNGLLFKRLGVLVDRYAQNVPGLTIKLATTLGEDPLIFDLFEHRLREKYYDTACTK